MKSSEMPKCLGRLLQIRPRARRFDARGTELPAVADAWLCEGAFDSRLTLSNPRSGHALRLPYDHVIEFRADTKRDDAGTLVLKSQVFLFGSKVLVEPMHPYQKGSTPLPDEICEARWQAQTESIGKLQEAWAAVMQYYTAAPGSRVARQAAAGRQRRRRSD